MRKGKFNFNDGWFVLLASSLFFSYMASFIFLHADDDRMRLFGIVYLIAGVVILNYINKKYKSYLERSSKLYLLPYTIGGLSVLGLWSYSQHLYNLAINDSNYSFKDIITLNYKFLGIFIVLCLFSSLVISSYSKLNNTKKYSEPIKFFIVNILTSFSLRIIFWVVFFILTTIVPRPG